MGDELPHAEVSILPDLEKENVCVDSKPRSLATTLVLFNRLGKGGFLTGDS